MSSDLKVQDKKDLRGKALRQLVIFNVKLALDGLKDMVLLPASLALGILSILTNSKDPASGLHTTMRWGRKFDDYVGLYSAIEKQESSQLDGQLEKAERNVREKVRKRRPSDGTPTSDDKPASDDKPTTDG